MIGPVVQTDAAVMAAGTRAYASLPPKARAILLVVAVLVGMAGCSAAWIDHQSYQPLPNVCSQAQAERTDCVHVQRPVPSVAEVAR